MAFEKTVPSWNATGAEPPESLKNSGFTPGYKPPADYFNWFWHSVSQCLLELQQMTPEDIGAASPDTLSQMFLPLTGGALTGALTVIDNFNVNKTYDSTEYKTYLRPINYSVGNNGDYSAGLILYKGETNQAQLMFNKDGVMLRDNVAGKAYSLFGQHNASVAATSIRSNLYTYGTTNMTANSSALAEGKMYLQYE